MVFEGWLLKINGTVFPNELIALESYKCTPDQIMDLDPYRDGDGLFYLGLKIKELLLSFLNSGWDYALSFVLFLVSTYVLFKLHYRIFFIRKRLVVINIFNRILCFIPVLLINLVMWLFYLNIMHEWIKSIISITFIITEIIGLIYFMGRYLTYEYSFANIHLKNGTVISEIDIDKIKRKAKWIIIEKSKSEIRVKFEEFNRIDYYGEQKVKLIDNWAHTILKKIIS